MKSREIFCLYEGFLQKHRSLQNIDLAESHPTEDLLWQLVIFLAFKHKPKVNNHVGKVR